MLSADAAHIHHIEYLGEDCSIPKVCGGSCYKACDGTIKVRSEKCEFCKGQCLTLVRNPVLGRHSPFDDIVSLLGLPPSRSASGGSSDRRRSSSTSTSDTDRIVGPAEVFDAAEYE